MKTVILLRGLPASGKSTIAKKMVEENPGMYKRLNKDDLRAMMDHSAHSTSNEKFVERVRDYMLIEALKEGKHVVIDDTNLSPRPVERITQVIQNYTKETGDQVRIEIREVETSLDECLERDAAREASVGKKVIMRMYKQHVLGDERGPHYKVQNKDLPPAIICDLDGTLAILKGRSPFDSVACEFDHLNEPVVELAKTYQQLGNALILMSGREEKARPATERWLATHGIRYQALFMRATGDQRKDSQVKKELFETHVQGKYYIRFVLDDRDQVVDLWRLELGLPCLQVNYGDF